MSYGYKLKEIRRANLLSQEEFAKRTGISRSIISQVEIDRIKPTIDALKKIATTFNISLDYLMRDDAETATNVLSANAPTTNSPISGLETNHNMHFNKLNEPPEALFRKHRTIHENLFIEDVEEKELRQTQVVPLVAIANREKYFRDASERFDRNKYVSLQLPIFCQSETRAFEIENILDNTRNDILVCSLYDKHEFLLNDPMVLISADQLHNGVIEEKQDDNVKINGNWILLNAIQESWKIELNISTVSKNNAIHQQLNRIESMLEQISKKKKKNKKK